MIKHIQRWNEWRKHNANGPVYKLLVLLKLARSPTFEIVIPPKEVRKIQKEFDAIFGVNYQK